MSAITAPTNAMPPPMTTRYGPIEMKSRTLFPRLASWTTLRTWYTYRKPVPITAAPRSSPAIFHQDENATTTTSRPSTSTTIPRLMPGLPGPASESMTNLAGIVYAVRAAPSSRVFAPQFNQLERAASTPPITIRMRPTLAPRPVGTAVGAVEDIGNPLGCESGREAERRVPVGDEQERVRRHAKAPAHDTGHEIEHPARVAAGEQDGEPGDDHHDDHRDVEEEQQDVVRDREEPLHQREPAVELVRGVGIHDIDVDGLLPVHRRVLVPQQEDVGADSRLEPEQHHVEVEPPPRVLVAQRQQGDHREEQQQRHPAEGVPAEPRAPEPEQRQQQQQRDRQDQSEPGGDPVQLPVRIVDRERQRIWRCRLCAHCSPLHVGVRDCHDLFCTNVRIPPTIDPMAPSKAMYAPNRRTEK